MDKLFTVLLGFCLIVSIVLSVVILFGCMEALWWVFTGSFFHFLII